MPTSATRPLRASAPPAEGLVGEQLGPLRLLRPLGRGGFAPVWLAEEHFGDKRLRNVALKLFFLPGELEPSSVAADRFYESVVEEARALCRVEHPNVVRFYSLHRDDALGLLGLAMEYVPGPSLHSQLESSGPLDEKTVLEAGISVAWALAAVHDAGLVHCDVKPANIVRGASGYKLIDFGIFAPIPSDMSTRPRRTPLPTAGAEEQTLPKSPGAIRIAGTPGYIAPECLRQGAPPTPASDLYALGVTLFRLSTGSMPPQPAALGPGRAPRAFNAAIQGSPGFREVVEGLLAPDPLARPRHADQVARQLEDLARPLGLGRRSFPPPAAPGQAPGVAESRSSGIWPSCDAGYDTFPDLCAHPALVGRDEVLAALGRAAEGARRGQIHMMLLSGPMGIGRSRLLEAALEAAEARGMLVLRARCAPERRQPYGPLAEALSALSSRSARELGLLLEAVEQAMVTVLAPGQASGRGLPAPPTDTALEGLEQALLEASAAAPLVLAIDDLHWADTTTLQLLVRLSGRAAERGRLFVLLTARDEPHPSPALLSLLARMDVSLNPALRRVRLAPLSPEEARRMAQGVGACAGELAEAVTRGAGGVPSLVVHALFAWRELGAIAWQNGAFRPTDERPLHAEVPGVAELLEARLGACFANASAQDEAARRTLSCVALHGGGLPLDIVLFVLGQVEATRENAQEAIDALVHAGILELSPEHRKLGFAQEMVRQAALNLTRHRSWFTKLHCALLDSLGAQKPATVDAAFLATGYERAGDWRKARRWLRRAIDEAAGAGLFDEAAALGDRLAALTPQPRQRRRVELDLVRMAIRGRLFEVARQRLEDLSARSNNLRPARRSRALALGDPSSAALVAKSMQLDLERRVYKLEVARGLGEESVGDATLLADTDALDDPVLACEARLALAGVVPPAEGLALASEAVALAAQAGGVLEFQARVRRLEINQGSGRCEDTLAEEDLRRAREIAASSGSAWHRIHIEGDLAILEAELGQPEAAIVRLKRLSDEARERRMRGQERLLLQNMSALLLRVGQNDDAARAAGRAAELAAAAGDTGLRARALSVRADALTRLGAFKNALACINEAAQLQEQLGDARRALSLLRRAGILESLGRAEEALADARLARQVAEEQGEMDLGLSAMLWEALRLSRMGRVGPEAVEHALELARGTEVTRRPLTLRLMAEAEACIAALRTEHTLEASSPASEQG